MAGHSLADWVAAQDDLVSSFRAQGQRGSQDPRVYSIPPERTNWVDEQRALLDGCALGDLSHHMTAVSVTGPDAAALLSHVAVNDVTDLAVGRATQLVMVSPEGYLIGDGPILRRDDDRFYGAGVHGSKWLRFQYETGDWDCDLHIEPPTPLLPEGEPPARFVYQLQGPTTGAVMDAVTDADHRSIDFFGFAPIELAGHPVLAFGHGMSPEAGYELIGDWSAAAAVRAAILEAGADHGIAELGRRTYVAQSTRLGWVPPWPKPVYTAESMAAYRDWVNVEREHAYGKAYWTDDGSLETTFSIEGSLDSPDVTDYYLDPLEVGYGKLVDFDHEFVGKAALERRLAEQTRTLVTLVWVPSAVAEVHDSVFGDGPLRKGLGPLPLVRRATMPYDVVRRAGEPVGTSYIRSFQWDVRTVVSLAAVDLEHRQAGTELTVEWGEPGGHSPNPAIENHTPMSIPVTVRPAPYATKEK